MILIKETDIVDVCKQVILLIKDYFMVSLRQSFINW